MKEYPTTAQDGLCYAIVVEHMRRKMVDNFTFSGEYCSEPLLVLGATKSMWSRSNVAKVIPIIVTTGQSSHHS